MILTVDELRRFVQTDDDDYVLQLKLEAIETAIKGYTNNDFRRVLEANGGEYPADIKIGVANLLKWDMNHREKIGISYEMISRHSVSYSNTSGKEGTSMGYPVTMVAFLRPYMRARFGGGSV